MSLFWLCYSGSRGVEVVILESSALIQARMKASLAGLDDGDFTEGHELPPSARVPKAMQGRRLSRVEASELIERLAAKRKSR